MQRERGPWSIPQEVSDGTRSSWSLVQSTSFLSQATLSVTREREFRESNEMEGLSLMYFGRPGSIPTQRHIYPLYLLV